MDNIAVLIPCFNEEPTIGKVVSDFRVALPDAKIYVYDNNSTDGTAKIAKENGAIVRFEPKHGKGNVIRRMLREIDAECYILVDGDDTYPAAPAREMADLVLAKNMDMVVGDRLSSTYFKENKRRFHNSGNALVRGTINRLFGANIRDIMTGYRAFSYQFAKSFPALSEGFEIETEMSIFAADRNMAIENVVIEYRDRPEGSVSKLNTYSDGAKVLLMIARLFRIYRPMLYFSIISIVLAILATIFVIPVIIEYHETGLVPRFPTLITCGFVYVMAMLSFYAGVILQTLRQKDRQDFEMRLNVIARERGNSTNNTNKNQPIL